MFSAICFERLSISQGTSPARSPKKRIDALDAPAQVGGSNKRTSHGMSTPVQAGKMRKVSPEGSPDEELPRGARVNAGDAFKDIS